MSVHQRVFRPAWWANNAHVQTIFPVILPFDMPTYMRERWDTPDDDFIDLDWVNFESAANVGQKIFILFHGLEGSSKSSYAKALMSMAQSKGWSGVVVHWRSCSGEINRQRVMYHSGFSAEIDWVLKRMEQRFSSAQLYAGGVSLGGNALLKWLGENGAEAGRWVKAAVGICAPHDLKAGAIALQRGFNQRVYMRNFLGTLKQKALLKLEQFPDLPMTVSQVRAARNFFDVDNDFTAPLHGFKDAEDYWQKSSSKQFMGSITVPTLILNAVNDPIVPVHSLATANEVGKGVTLCYTDNGGHVGFITTRQNKMKHFSWMPDRVFSHFEAHA